MEYQNIHLTDEILYQQFKDAYARGDYASALSLLSQGQLTTKRLDAQAVNTISQFIKKEQRHLYTNVDELLEAYIERKEIGLQNYEYVGVYSSVIEYKANNVVEFEGDYYYLPIAYDKDNQLPPPESPWVKIGRKGKDGIDGIDNLTFKGEYDTSFSYSLNDVVYSDNTFYWAKQASLNVPLSNTQYWGILIQGQAQEMVTSDSESGLADEDIWLEII